MTTTTTTTTDKPTIPRMSYFLAAFMRAPDGTLHAIDVDDLPDDWSTQENDAGFYRVGANDVGDGPLPTQEEMVAALGRLVDARRGA